MNMRTSGRRSAMDDDARVLAAVLGIPAERAAALLRDWGGLRGLLAASRGARLAAPGLGRVRVARYRACWELVARTLAAELSVRPLMDRPEAVAEYLRTRCQGLEHEEFHCLFLDNRHRLLAAEALFRGTIDGASVYPREVVKRALVVNAAALIVAHNHPSGVAEPSAADQALTERLRSALALVDIRLLDHLVVADGGWVSLASRGWL